MIIDRENRELTAAEIDLVQGGKKLEEAKRLQELESELNEAADDAKGGGGASELVCWPS
jgi:hypothetical protein